MHCSQCGASIAADSKFCASCGAAVGGQAAGAPRDAKPAATKPATSNRGCLIAGGIIVALILFAAVAGAPDANKVADENAAPVGPARSVTAMELWQAYDANEAAAQQEYGDQRLAVSGIVDGVDLDFANDPVVKLKTGNQFQSVQASLTDAAKPQASGLSKGQEVVLTCDSVSEVIGSPMLKDCTL